MRFTVQSDDINHSLNLVTRALPQRSPKDVYEGVFIETTEEGVQLTCTNGEMSIKTLAPAIIAEDGCALLPAKLLAELLRKMNGEISIQTEDAQKALINLMVGATERIPNLGAGRPVFYLNRKIREALRFGILEKISNNLTWETVEGKRVLTFDDIVVQRTDALVNNESRVVA